MTFASAPAQLPFAPTPFRNELFSSWMLRIAAANVVSLEELLLGLEANYPEVPCPDSLDWRLTPPFLKTMARFSRVSERRLRSLDLGARLPQAGNSLLLSFGPTSDQCTRLREKRAGYSFCPTCVFEQPHVYVRWEWAFPALLRCPVHKTPLRQGCPACGEDDPLPLGSGAAFAAVLCWNCGENLTRRIAASHCPKVDAAQAFVEKLYRAALRGSSPPVTLLGDATGVQLRRFVDDMFLLLSWYPSPELSPALTDPRNRHLPFRTKILATVGSLVMDAALNVEPTAKRPKSSGHFALWHDVISLFSGREEELIEASTELWPATLRQRFISAVDQYEGRRPRRSPFRSTLFRPGFKYSNRLKFRDLSAGNGVEKQNSGI